MRSWAAVAILVGLLACGGDEPDRGPGAAWREPGAGATALNRPPEIASVRIVPEEPAPGDTVQAVVRVSDADGQKLDLGFAWSVDAQPRSVQEGALRLDGVSAGSAVEVRVTVSDGEDEAVGSARVWVRDRRPVVTGLELQPAGVVPRGETLRVRAVGRDPDGDPVEIRYEWLVNRRPVDVRGDTFPTTDLSRGDRVQVRAIPGDGTHEGEALESAVVEVGNGAPVIVSAPASLAEDGSFRYAVEARDPDGDGPLRYTLRRGPEGMRLDRDSGELSWRATSAQAGSHRVAVAVEDPHGATRVQEFELNVRVEGPQAPAAPAR